jgi:hypothetical protein
MSDQGPENNVDDAIRNALAAGNKLEAIKLYREAHGVALTEAKQKIDEWAVSEGYDRSVSGKGCATVFVLAILCGPAAALLIRAVS